MARPSARLEALIRFNAALLFAPAQTGRRLLEGLAPEGLSGASPEELAAAGGLSLEAAGRLKAEAAAFDLEAELALCERLGARFLSCEDAEFPDLLKSVSDPPLILYARGSLAPQAAALAFVGSRRPTPYGLRMARFLAGRAAEGGLTVASGLARGIDTAAHRAALAAGGRTWAVLGSGLSRLYPPENEGLARDIVSSGGCVLSEYPLSTPPLPANFPRRNRIVAGLAWGTVVVEGTDRSGSLITARLACEQGRPVFAVPGPADSPLSQAPHRLIREGAKLVATMEDVWEELPPALRPAPRVAGQGRPQAPLPGEHQKILELLGSESRCLEDLGCETGLDLPRLSAILFEMELQGLLRAVPGQRYAKKTVG
jgi:DNA processing protein